MLPLCRLRPDVSGPPPLTPWVSAVVRQTPLGERNRGEGFFPFFFSLISFSGFSLGTYTKVVRDRLTVNASVKRSASAPGSECERRCSLAGLPMMWKGSWMCHAGVTQSRLHSPH